MTRLQQRNLKLWLRFRGQRLTILGLIWANRRMYLLLILAFGTLAALAYIYFGALGAWFLLVAFAAVFVRDIGFYRRSVAIWPIFQQVFDWNKVEELASSDAPPTSNQSLEPTAGRRDAQI
jgi:hypothetical protein